MADTHTRRRLGAHSPTLYRQIGRVKLLTAAQEVALAKRIERGDLDAKSHLVEANLRLVAKLAGCYHAEGFTHADLVQEGVIGLIRAAEKFDYRKGLKFSTYASIWIREAIGRAVRDRDRLIRVPSDVARLAARIRRSDQALTAALGRRPSPEQIAEDLGLPAAKVTEAIELTRDIVSLERPVAGAGAPRVLGDLLPAPPAAASPSVEGAASALGRDVADALRGLDDLSRMVLEWRYGLGETGEQCSVTQTAVYVGRSGDTVRRVERDALAALKEGGRIAAHDPAPVAA